MTIDLNCDLGEGVQNDALIMPYITSANIACGYHAGNHEMMVNTIALAKKYQVAIGAHPGYNDKANFGRIELQLSGQEYYQLIIEQLTIFKKFSDAAQINIRHIKPHGAMYNQAAKDKNIAAAIVKAVKDFDENLILFGRSGSHLINEAVKLNIRTASEVFADRTYQNDGSLTPRNTANALIEDEATSLKQVLQMVKNQSVRSVNNVDVPVVANTICLHSDGAKALSFAKNIFEMLQSQDIQIKAPQ